jgi:ankyrin repeat protein
LFDAIKHYVYAGDTALHVAAAAYRYAIVRSLLAAGANVHAKNRRGAEPLHYVVDGGPRNPAWDPAAQVETIEQLLAAGANPNATDKGGVTAVRNRCARRRSRSRSYACCQLQHVRSDRQQA